MNTGRVIIFSFLLGALLVAIIVLALAALGIVASGPALGPKFTILKVEGEPFALLPYFNYSASPRYPYHSGAMGWGGGFVLNSTSEITGKISSTAGISWFLWSESNPYQYLLQPSFNASASMGAGPGFIYTTGNVISTRIDLILTPGRYEWFVLDPNQVPSNMTDSLLVAAPIS